MSSKATELRAWPSSYGGFEVEHESQDPQLDLLLLDLQTLYMRGGQTCSMYEPHIVKPKLQRAANIKN